jgi:energy-converting hydrogenase A subunit P
LIKNRVDLKIEKCVNTFSKHSTCNSCVEECPTNAIFRDENSLLTINQSECVECGSCISACNNSAISLQNFSLINSIFSLLEKDEKLILDCKKNISCISAFTPDELLSLMVFKNSDIDIELSHCSTCQIFPNLIEKIESLISETNLLLEAFNLSHKIKILNEQKIQIEKKEVDLKRRSMFDTTIFQQSRKDFNSLDLAKIERGTLPDRRKLFLMALKRIDIKSDEVLHSEDISFTSDKEIDETCTNCSICYRVCPTKALSSDYKNSFIDFDMNLCVKCHLCHDVCETDSIKLVNLAVKDFKREREKRLVSFNIAKCTECEAYFTRFNSETMCRRCTIEENEALDLWGF